MVPHWRLRPPAHGRPLPDRLTDCGLHLTPTIRTRNFGWTRPGGRCSDPRVWLAGGAARRPGGHRTIPRPALSTMLFRAASMNRRRGLRWPGRRYPESRTAGKRQWCARGQRRVAAGRGGGIAPAQAPAESARGRCRGGGGGFAGSLRAVLVPRPAPRAEAATHGTPSRTAALLRRPGTPSAEAVLTWKSSALPERRSQTTA